MLRRRSVPIAVVILTLAFARPGFAQVLDEGLWATNGDVAAVARFGETIYIGGTFSRVGPVSGGGIPIDAASGTLVPGFPKVAGQVYAAASDGAGGWYIGGSFTHVGGLPRANIAHVESDLSVSAWNPGAGGNVHALAVRGSTVYVGGEFIILGGEFRFNVGALDGPTGLTMPWNPSADGTVYSLFVHTYSFSCGGGICFETRVYAGGDFANIGGQPRSRIASLDITNGAATTWNPSANGSVREIVVVGNSSIAVRAYAAGQFTTLGGQPRNYIGQVNLSGVATTWNPNANAAVTALAVGGSIYAGGAFTSIGGQPRNHIAALDASGAATAWDPNANGDVHALLANGSTIYAGGAFTLIGALAQEHLAKLDAASGTATTWTEGTDGIAHALALGGSTVYAGGAFSIVGGLPRDNIAALDAKSGAPTGWNPGANGRVHALAVSVRDARIYAGGEFTFIGGAVRMRIAAIDPNTGGATAWNPSANATVRALATNDGRRTVYVGGDFTFISDNIGTRLAEIDATTGLSTSLVWHVNGPVYAIARAGNEFWVGGAFSMVGLFVPCNNLAFFGTSDGELLWNPSPNQAVHAIAIGQGVYVGGAFTTIGSQSRNHIAMLDFGAGMATAWNPGANGTVRALAVTSNLDVYAGGDFDVIAGVSRRRFAQLDGGTGVAKAFDPGPNGSVYGLALYGSSLYVGGQFTGIAGMPARGIAGFANPVTCATSGPTSPTGAFPRALVAEDFDNDGIRDLVVCNAVAESATLLRGGGSGGTGNGTFSTQQVLQLGSRLMHAVAADFNVDGQQDLALSRSGPNGPVEVFLNTGGGFQLSTTTPTLGHPDGVAAADVTQDGILDLVVCLADSAGLPNRGGLQILRGGGQGGVWDQTFTTALKTPRGPNGPNGTGPAHRAIVHDFNQDGVQDIAFTRGNVVILRFAAALVPTCIETRGSTGPYALTIGDYDADGKTDIALGDGAAIQILLNRAGLPGCQDGSWFDTDVMPTPTPGAPREMASVDFDQDGILDIVATFDELGSVQWFRGNGTAGVGDGTFQSPVTLANTDVSGIAVGDFVTNGSPDLAISQPHCDQVFVIENPNSPNPATGLTLVVPNGGEIWGQGSTAPMPAIRSTAGIERDTESRFAHLSCEATPAGGVPEISSAQQITWSKGAGILNVDVQVSRDDGASWQTIAANLPGTSMTWIVTPPGTPSARVRVRDSAIPSRMDGSDAAFSIPADPATDVSPDDGAPRVAAFALRDRNPVRDAVRFKMDVPKATEARVQVFDVRGRMVRTVLSAAIGAGRHEVTWDTRDASRTPVARGVYFIRARFDAFTAERKVVVLR